jgi:hypothetical protein
VIRLSKEDFVKKLIWCLSVAVLLCFNGGARAQSAEMTSPNVMSVNMQLGAATAFIDAPDGAETDSPMVRFAGGGEFRYSHYFSETVALSFGVGLLGKGYRDEGTAMGYDYKGWSKHLALEIPFGVLMNFSGFHLGIDLVTTYLLVWKLKVEANGESDEQTIDDWEGIRRVNLCPRLSLGYGIPAGAVAIVPGVMWEIDLLNVSDQSELTYRHMNVMFTLGVDFSL